MATAKQLGINVDEETLESVQVVDGKVIVSLKGTELVKVVDKNMLIDNAAEFISPVSKLSVNSKIYSATALNRDLITKEFVEAAKNISAAKKVEIIAQSTALETAGASTAESTKVASAKAAREAARKDWDAALASGDKAAADAAQKAFEIARDAEAVADMAAADSVAKASVAAVEAQAATAEVAEAAQAAASAAQEASTEVAAAAKDATRAAQEATLAALQEIEAMPGGSSWDAFRAQAAIEQVKAEMEGRSYSGQFGDSYEDSMKEIERMENSGKSAVECISQEGC